MTVTPVEQVQQQFNEAVGTLRTRAEDAVDEARTRAREARELAVKLAYAYVGAIVVAQERVSVRFSQLVNSR